MSADRISLSKEQRDAANAVQDGVKNVAILAAAGSGKTTTIAQTAIELIEDYGVDQEDIILLSFSTEAVAELQTRLGAYKKSACTFHSLAFTEGSYPFGGCVDRDTKAKTTIWQAVLDKHARAYAQQEEVQDEGAEALFTLTLRTEEDTKVAKRLTNLATRMSAEGIRPYSAEAAGWLANNKASSSAAQYLKDYQAEVKRRGMWTYADTIADHHDTASGGYRFVFVDEAQDMDPILLSTAIKLAKNGRLIAVGDLRQTIHVWKGANPDIFEAFANHAQTDRVYLNENRRSVPDIVELSNEVVRAHPYGNPAAVATRPPQAGTGWGIFRASPLTAALTKAEEYRVHAKEDEPVLQIGVLTRTWKELREFEDAAFKAGIRYETKQRWINTRTIDRVGTKKLSEENCKDAKWFSRLDWLVRQDETLTNVCAKAREFTSAREFRDWAYAFIDGQGPRHLYLGTAHSSKGLTIETVIVAPSDRWLEPEEDEQRHAEERLLYVALTRARNLLFVCPTETGKLPAACR
jgi:superfamily I DNA/RNA helicase